MNTSNCSGLDQQFQHYVQAQLEKINSAITDHSREIRDFSFVYQKLDRHSKCLGEVDRKIKVLEVYQSENFSNHQRLFQAQGNIEFIEKRLFMLQDIAQNGSLPLSQQQTSPSLQNLELKIGQIEDEISKLKHKQTAIVKFRRDLSPLNCQSTKDVSADAKTEFRKMQKKLQDFIVQRFEQFQMCFRSVGNYREGKKEKEEEGEEIQTEIAGANRKTRVRMNHQFSQNTFKNKINQYYHQETASKKDVSEAREKHKEKSSSRSKKEKRKSESKSKSKKKAAELKREGVRSSERIALKSVNEYIRLRQNRNN